jgi:hypothetical protein
MHLVVRHRRRTDGVEQRIEIVQHEVRVLEVPEQAEVDAYRDCQVPLSRPTPAAMDACPKVRIGRNGHQQNQQVLELAPGVEEQARSQQQQIAYREPRQQKIAGQYGRQEQENENGAGEDQQQAPH